MPYTVPSYAQFIARFPIFDDSVKYPQSVVEFIITEASGQVDNDWLVRDYQPAIMYLAAHLLATDNSESGGEVQVGTEEIASESFSGMSVTYRQASGGLATSQTFGATAYGRRYLYLLKLNKPAVVVA